VKNVLRLVSVISSPSVSVNVKVAAAQDAEA